MIRVTSSPLRVDDVLEALETSQSGSLVLHIGLVRNSTHGKSVSAIALDSSDTTEQDLRKIESHIREQWPAVQDFMIAHRFGRLQVGEIICIVAASTPHRQDAFQACSTALDQIKSLHSVCLTEIGG